MTVMLVTLEQARAHLHSDTTADDDNLTQKIASASALVLRYLDDAAPQYIDPDGNPVGVPDEVIAATLMMVGYLYRERDSDEEKAYAQGFLPNPVSAMLYPLRAPVFS